jgi:hypothetical protein
MIELGMWYLTKLCVMFEDFEKAFDSVNRNRMWEVVNKYGIP